MDKCYFLKTITIAKKRQELTEADRHLQKPTMVDKSRQFRFKRLFSRLCICCQMPRSVY